MIFSYKKRFISAAMAAVMLFTSITLPAAAAEAPMFAQQSEESVIGEQPAILETVSAAGMVHPSAGLNAASLKLMQQKLAIGAEPWASAFEAFRSTPSASLDYDVRNKSKIDPALPAYTLIDGDAKAKEAKVDAAAAFSHAVMWTATGDVRYRAKAMEIIRLWSQIDPSNPVGFYDSHISIGDAMQNMVRAAELLRYTEAEGDLAWTEQDTDRFINNFLMAFYDGSFYYNNNRWMNQHSITTSSYMMAAIFSDNQSWYKEAVEWATANKSVSLKGQSGDIFNQIRYTTVDERTGLPVEPHVQLVELFRDIGHASINIDLLSSIAFMTKVQGTKVDPDPGSPTFGEITSAANGVDLFDFLDNRILAGADYLAQYDLGQEVLFTPQNISNGIIGDATATYSETASDNGRGLNSAGSLVYGYYLHHRENKLSTDDDRLQHLHELITKYGGLNSLSDYVLLYGTEDLSTGVELGAPKPLEQPTYAETKAAYDRRQAFDYLGRSSSVSTNTFQDEDGMRSVLYDVRYANQFTWYDLDLEDSYNTITMRVASNSSVGTKIDVVLLDNVAGLDRSNVTLDNIASGEVLATLTAPNTGWWTNYATVSGKLSKPLEGEHLLAFKYYGSANALSYQIAFDWFAFSNHFAGVDNNAVDADLLSGGAAIGHDGVEMSSGSSISFNSMNYDSGNNTAEFSVKTTDASGKLSLYSGEELITAYSLINTQGSFLKVTSQIAASDIGKLTGIQDITLKYEGTSPIVLKTYKNVERNRLLTSKEVSKAVEIEDQAIRMDGPFAIDTEGARSYVKVSNGSLLYLSKGALQTDRTKDSYVTFMIKSNAMGKIHLQRTSVAPPFATALIPNTHGKWATVSYNISQQYVNVLDYPTTVKSVFVAIESQVEGAEILLDSYELNPGNLPPSITLSSEDNQAIDAVTLIENGENYNVKVAVADGDSVNVTLSHDGIDFVDSSFDGKNGGIATIKPEGVEPGSYTLQIMAKDDSSNYIVKELSVNILSSEDYVNYLVDQSGVNTRIVDMFLDYREVYDTLSAAKADAINAPTSDHIAELKEAIVLVQNTLPSYTRIKVNYSTNGTANVVAGSDMLSFYVDGTATDNGVKIGGTGALSTASLTTYADSEWIPLNQKIAGKHNLKLVWAYPANVRSIVLSNDDGTKAVSYDALSASAISSTLLFQPSIENGKTGYAITNTAALSYAIYSGLQLNPELVYTSYPYKGVYGDGVNFWIRPAIINAIDTVKPYIDQQSHYSGKPIAKLKKLYAEALALTSPPSFTSGNAVLSHTIADEYTAALLAALAEVKAGAEPVKHSTTEYPVLDLFVHQSSANTTFMNADFLVGGGREALLRFDLSQIPSDKKIVNATLRMYKLAGPSSVIVFSNTLDTWNNKTTFNTKPAIGTEITRLSAGGTGYYYVDLTQAASEARTSDGIFSMHLNRSATQNANHFGSSRYEDVNMRVALIVTTEEGLEVVLDTEPLTALLDEAREKAASGEAYSSESLAALQAAIAAAEAALASSTLQEELDAAAASLQAAIQGLTASNTAVLTGPPAAQPGQSIELAIGVNGVNLPDDFKMLEAVVKYDPAKIEFNTIVNDNGTRENAEDDIVSLDEQAYTVDNNKLSVIGSAIKQDKGEILLLLLVSDEALENGELIKLNGRVKASAELGTAAVSLSRLVAAGSDSVVQFKTEQASLAITVGVDKGALSAAIASANQLYVEAEVGSQAGQYPQDAKDALHAAIQAAIVIHDDASASQLTVTSALQALQTAVQAFRSAVIPYVPSEPVDTAVLRSAITAAQSRYDKAVEGNKIGQYPQAARLALRNAIATAIAVRDSSSATQAQINTAAAELNQAVQLFAAQIVSFVSGATSITIRDLSVIASYFGVKQGDAGWSFIEKADVTGQNEINIVTLAAAARLIIADWLAAE